MTVLMDSFALLKAQALEVWPLILLKYLIKNLRLPFQYGILAQRGCCLGTWAKLLKTNETVS